MRPVRFALALLVPLGLASAGACSSSNDSADAGPCGVPDIVCGPTPGPQYPAGPVCVDGNWLCYQYDGGVDAASGDSSIPDAASGDAASADASIPDASPHDSSIPDSAPVDASAVDVAADTAAQDASEDVGTDATAD